VRQRHLILVWSGRICKYNGAQLARGKSDAEIMATLQIAPRTLRHHLQNVMEKIGAQERAQAMWWALENRLGEKRLRETPESYAADEK